MRTVDDVSTAMSSFLTRREIEQSFASLFCGSHDEMQVTLQQLWDSDFSPSKVHLHKTEDTASSASASPVSRPSSHVSSTAGSLECASVTLASQVSKTSRQSPHTSKMNESAKCTLLERHRRTLSKAPPVKWKGNSDGNENVSAEERNEAQPTPKKKKDTVQRVRKSGSRQKLRKQSRNRKTEDSASSASASPVSRPSSHVSSTAGSLECASVTLASEVSKTSRQSPHTSKMNESTKCTMLERHRRALFKAPPVKWKGNSDGNKNGSAEERNEAQPTPKKRKDTVQRVRKSGSRQKLRKQSRNRWTLEESTWLKLGVEKYGLGNWSTILASYNFYERTNVNLKDRWRNMVKRDPPVPKKEDETLDTE
uniref:Telomeric repeat-binding factor n=1 Tax=Eptatretus burgeri TaxID=7764 RepID=A0A8C4Q1I6_EPTBU